VCKYTRSQNICVNILGLVVLQLFIYIYAYIYNIYIYTRSQNIFTDIMSTYIKILFLVVKWSNCFLYPVSKVEQL
jgi:hypothetical protein